MGRDLCPSASDRLRNCNSIRNLLRGTQGYLLRHLPAYSLATRFRVFIWFGVHGICGMHRAKGIIDRFVRLILRYAGNMWSGEPASSRLLSTFKTELVVHRPFLLKVRMQRRLQSSLHLFPGVPKFSERFRSGTKASRDLLVAEGGIEPPTYGL